MRISDWSSDVCSSDLASGGDRAIVAREIEKIALFLDAGADRPGEIDDAALDAIGADLGDAEMSRAIAAAVGGDTAAIRSEEHTSELQSLMRISYAVFCLKKKTNK